MRVMDVSGIVSPEDSASHLKSYLKVINVELDMAGIVAKTAKQREFLSKQVNMQRMSNNPVGLTQEHTRQIFNF